MCRGLYIAPAVPGDIEVATVLEQVGYLVAGDALFLRALDPERLGVEVEVEFARGTIEGELVEQVAVDLVVVTIGDEVAGAAYAEHCRTHHEHRAVETAAIERDEMVEPRDVAPEVFEDVLFRAGDIFGAVFFEFVDVRAVGLEIDLAFLGGRIHQRDRNNLRSRRPESKHAFGVFLFFFGLGTLEEVFLLAVVQAVPGGTDRFDIKDDRRHRGRMDICVPYHWSRTGLNGRVCIKCAYDS